MEYFDDTPRYDDDSHPLYRKIRKRLKGTFALLENQAFEDVLSHDDALQQFDYDTTTLITCKEVSYGERKGEVWKITTFLDKRVVDQETSLPLRTISIEPVRNVAADQQSYQYDVEKNTISYLVTNDVAAEGLIEVREPRELIGIVKLAELLSKGNSLDATEELSQKSNRRLRNIINLLLRREQ